MLAPIAIGVVDTLILVGGMDYKTLFYMASVYILFSNKLDRFYTGSCLDLSYRINQHLNKEFIKIFTAKTDDWELYFFMDDLQYEQCRHVERHIKNMKSKKYITNLKLHPAIAIRLKEKYIV